MELSEKSLPARKAWSFSSGGLFFGITQRPGPYSFDAGSSLWFLNPLLNGWEMLQKRYGVKGRIHVKKEVQGRLFPEGRS